MNSEFKIGNLYSVTESNKFKITNDKIIVNPQKNLSEIYLSTRSLTRALTNDTFKTATLSLETNTKFGTSDYYQEEKFIEITPTKINLNTSIDNTYTYTFSVSSEVPLNNVYSIDGLQTLGYIKNVNGRACVLSHTLTYTNFADGKYNYNLVVEIMIESGYSKKNPRFVLNIILLFQSLFGTEIKRIEINLVTETE